jgi:cytochrome c oxidase cbb3-type subunit I
MMSIKTVNGLSHYTDWTVGHVHSGAGLGGLHDDGLAVLPDSSHVRPDADAQRAGHRTALLDRHHRHRAVHRRDVDRWRDAGPDVARGQPRRHLVYSFVEGVKATYPFYVVRLLGGLLYLTGMLIMAWNVVMTVSRGRAVATPVPALPAHA